MTIILAEPIYIQAYRADPDEVFTMEALARSLGPPAEHHPTFKHHGKRLPRPIKRADGSFECPICHDEVKKAQGAGTHIFYCAMRNHVPLPPMEDAEPRRRRYHPPVKASEENDMSTPDIGTPNSLKLVVEQAVSSMIDELRSLMSGISGRLAKVEGDIRVLDEAVGTLGTRIKEEHGSGVINETKIRNIVADEIDKKFGK